MNESIIQKLKRFFKNCYSSLYKTAFRLLKKYVGNLRFNNRLLDKTIPKAYLKAAKESVDENKIVFVEIRYPEISNNFKVILDKLEGEYDFKISKHFLLYGNASRKEYNKRVLKAVEDIATAKYVFLNEGSTAISAIPLRKETKTVQLWHGCGAFKKFGFSTAGAVFGANSKEQLKHPLNANYSLVTVSSPEVVWAFSEAMNIPEESNIIQPTGSSRTDNFFNKDYINESFDEIHKLLPVTKDKKIILYAPTFRGRVSNAKSPDELDYEAFFRELSNEYVLLIKHHPVVKSKPAVPEKYADFVFDVSDVAIDRLLCVSDICISDYSSLIFEYSLFEKPIILFAFDLDEYYDWRGFYYDYNEFAPGIIAKTNNEMIEYIKDLDNSFDKEAVKAFRDKFMRSCDGKSTERILEYVIEDLDSHRLKN